MNDNQVHVWLSDDTVWVRVVGAGTWVEATSVSGRARDLTYRGARQFAFDLGECTRIDSTFVGMMTGVALRLRELYRADRFHVQVLNANTEVATFITGLGLDQLMDLQPPASGSRPD